MTTKHEEQDYPSNAALVYDKIKASGNKIVGGTFVFTLLSHAKQELI